MKKNTKETVLNYSFEIGPEFTFKNVSRTIAVGTLLGVFVSGLWVTVQELLWLTYGLYKIASKGLLAIAGLF